MAGCGSSNWLSGTVSDRHEPLVQSPALGVGRGVSYMYPSMNACSITKSNSGSFDLILIVSIFPLGQDNTLIVV